MFRMQRSPVPNVNVQSEDRGIRVSLWKILIDIISLLILFGATLIAHYVGTPYQRGFFCSDTSIKYPFKSNTIPLYAVIIISILLPVFSMWITEIIKAIYFRFIRKEIFPIRLEVFRRGFQVLPVFRNIYILTVVFFYGYLATWLLTESSKNILGSLRPHFIARCRPSLNCSTLTTLFDFNRFLQFGSDYTCLNTNDEEVQETRRSFFSGHSSSIFYSMAWLIMYIHVSWSWRHVGIFGNMIQVGLAVLASYIAYSRITDNQHHWEDVAFGALVGAAIAFVSFKFILNWYSRAFKFLPHIISAQNRPPPVVRNR